jgi:hypothetical protein
MSTEKKTIMKSENPKLFSRDKGLSLDFCRSRTLNGRPQTRKRSKVEPKDRVVACSRVGNVTRSARDIVGGTGGGVGE